MFLDYSVACHMSPVTSHLTPTLTPTYPLHANSPPLRTKNQNNLNSKKCLNL